MIWFDLTWFHLISFDFTWFHLISHDFISFHLISFHFTWFHLISPWFHFISLDFISFHLLISIDFKIFQKLTPRFLNDDLNRWTVWVWVVDNGRDVRQLAPHFHGSNMHCSSKYAGLDTFKWIVFKSLTSSALLWNLFICVSASSIIVHMWRNIRTKDLNCLELWRLLYLRCVHMSNGRDGYRKSLEYRSQLIKQFE